MRLSAGQAGGKTAARKQTEGKIEMPCLLLWRARHAVVALKISAVESDGKESTRRAEARRWQLGISHLYAWPRLKVTARMRGTPRTSTGIQPFLILIGVAHQAPARSTSRS